MNARDKFDALFGDLYIGQHPTKDRNSYLVLKLNFSLVSSELHNYLYTYLLNTYDEAELSFSSYEKSDLDIYPDMMHSYIVELKYAKYKDPENRVEELRREAIEQANRYADTDTVKCAVGNTRLHKVVVVYKGMEMRVCEEVWSGRYKIIL